MARVGPPRTHQLLARLARSADLRGNADGVASKRELSALRTEVKRSTIAGAADPLHPVETRSAALEKAIGVAERAPIATLEPALTKLPEPLRRLALEVDGLWGDADGAVTAAEIDRVARYYLAALPFFSKEASALLELAEHLGYAKPAATVKNVLGLRLALAEVDKGEVARGQEFRRLFDSAVAEAEVPGLPGLLREAAEHSPRWHKLSILEHTAVATFAIATIAKEIGVAWKDAAAVMLLHDVGKLIGRGLVPSSDEESARYHFGGHEEAGAEWLLARGIDPAIAFHVAHHADLRGTSVDELFHGVCGGDRRKLREAIAVYVADQVAKGDAPDQLASFAEQMPKIRTLCELAGIDAEALFAARRSLVKKWFGSEVA